MMHEDVIMPSRGIAVFIHPLLDVTESSSSSFIFKTSIFPR